MWNLETILTNCKLYSMKVCNKGNILVKIRLDLNTMLCSAYSVYELSPGGRDCLSFSAFSLSVMTNVYRYLLQRTLNFTLSLFFLILTAGEIKNQEHASQYYWQFIKYYKDILK